MSQVWSCLASFANRNDDCAGANQAGGLSLPALFGGEQAVLRDPKRESAVQQSGIPFTVVRSGRIKDIPGSRSQLNISQDAQGSQDTTDIR